MQFSYYYIIASRSHLRAWEKIDLSHRHERRDMKWNALSLPITDSNCTITAKPPLPRTALNSRRVPGNFIWTQQNSPPPQNVILYCGENDSGIVFWVWGITIESFMQTLWANTSRGVTGKNSKKVQKMRRKTYNRQKNISRTNPEFL